MMSSQLDSRFKDAVFRQIDNLEEEAVFYVRQYFEELRGKYQNYSSTVTDNMVLSEEFKKLHEKVLMDRKVLEDLEKDVDNFKQLFILKDNFATYVKEFQKTHDRYVRFMEGRLIPELKVYRDPELHSKLKNTLQDAIHYDNTLADSREKTEELLNQEPKSIVQGNNSENVLMNRLDILSTDPANEVIDFLHFFQESSRTIHFNRLGRREVEWVSVPLSIGFNIPLFCSSIAARKDCILLIGGIESERRRTVGDVYVVNGPAKTLLKTGELYEPRNSFAVAKLRDKVYVVGGCGDKSGKLASCEVSVLVANPNRCGGIWERIDSLRYPCSNACLIPFQNRYLVKFGGIFEPTVHRDCFVELYHADYNEWFPVNVVLNDPGKPVMNANHMCDTISSTGVQYGESSVIIFGGLTSSYQRK